MRIFLSIIISVAAYVSAQAQNHNNNIEVVTNSAINFMISSPHQLENDQVMQNAITVTVKSKNNSSSVFARLSSATYPPGFIPVQSPLAIEWAFDNSDMKYNLNTSPIVLDMTDKLLFNQKKTTGNIGALDYYYNMILMAPGYNYIPGNYTFSILFTMTQP